jgi:hypothetical protein
MKVLASFTNKHKSEEKFHNACLVEIDSQTGKTLPIDIKHYKLNHPLAGIASLVHWEDTIIFFTDGCMVGQLDVNYRLKNVWAIPIEQAHTAVCLDNDIYIAGTAKDSVIRSGFLQDHHSVFWKHGLGEKDTIHLNSIAYHKGEFYISAFGARTDFWHSAQSGYIQNITTGERVVEDLKQPHTLVSEGGYLYYCNSATSDIRKVGSDENLHIEGNGYVRGMAFGKNILAVATSRGRKRSKSTGKEIVTNFTDPGKPVGQCAVHFYTRADCLNDYQHLRTVPLGTYGAEIFDVLLVDGSEQPRNVWNLFKSFFKK